MCAYSSPPPAKGGDCCGVQPALVLSAMGKTTNNLLAAGEAALEAAGVTPVSMEEGQYGVVRKLHLDTMDTLGTDAETRAEVVTLLDQLHQLLSALGIMQVRRQSLEP